MSEEPTDESPGMSEVPPPRLPRPDRPPVSPTDLLKPIARRGRLVTAAQPGGLDLLTENGRFELLGSFDFEVSAGDDVEVLGVPAPQARGSSAALLVRELRKLD